MFRQRATAVVVAVTCLTLTFACGPLRPRSHGWRPDIGPGLAETFQPGFVPPSQFYYTYAAPARPGRIFVSPSPHSGESVAYAWAPAGKPTGRYVFEIDPGAKTIDHVSWDRFVSLDIGGGDPPRETLADFSRVHPRGTLEAWRSVYPFEKEGTGWLAVLSFDDRVTARREIGLPSLFPFMGRQKVVERVEYHRGTAFLEIFLSGQASPAGPVFRMSKAYEDWRLLPELDELGGWVMGFDRPVLVVVDVAGSGPRPDEIVVVSPTLPAN